MKISTGAVPSLVSAAVVLALSAGPCRAQLNHPGEIPLPGTYQGSVELQRRADQEAKQFRDQQQQNNQSTPRATPPPENHSAEVRAAWQGRPALAADRNPLLGGRWVQRGITPGGPSGVGAANGIASMLGPEMARSVQGLVSGTMQTYCDSIFGQGGTIEFRPDVVVAIGRGGTARVLDQVDYRGGKGRVAVLARGMRTFDTLVFDFNGPNLITEAGLGCRLARGAGGATVDAALTTPGSPTATQATASMPQAVLSLATPLAGGHLLILRHSVDVALAKGGVTASAAGSPMKTWHVACETQAPACPQGRQALIADSAGIFTTDSGGRGRTQPIPAGHYYVFGAIRVDNRPMVWNVPVELKAGPNSLTLDRRNASPVD